MTIYVIKCLDGRNFVYVETREEAIKICAELPNVFTWEELDLYREGGRL
jgi:hypothetical protein